MTRLLAAMLLACIMALPSSADDSGLIVAAGVDKKVSKKLTVGAELEFRSRNNWRTADRLALSLDAQYKLLSWLKAGAGYELLVDNNPEKISYHTDGDLNNWRPSYWGTRHRLNATLTGTYTYKKRFSVSLRERYQFTCRPTHTTCRYDFDNAFWEDTDVNSRCKHVLRSRLKLEYDPRNCPVDPWASVEFFNALKLEKTRVQVGADYKIKKKHTLTLYYRYQAVNGDEDETETDMHMVGLGYNFKF